MNLVVFSCEKLSHTLQSKGTAVVYIPAISIKENIIPTIGPIFLAIYNVGISVIYVFCISDIIPIFKVIAAIINTIPPKIPPHIQFVLLVAVAPTPTKNGVAITKFNPL